MTAGMRIFLVFALVVAGGFGIGRLFDGHASGAGTPDTTTSVSSSMAPVISTAAVVETVAVVETSVAVAAVATAEPPASTLPVVSSYCPPGARAAVVDRQLQTAWLCETGVAVYEFRFTGAVSQPDPGTYPVYAKDANASSSSKAGVSSMTHFVAFTYGKFRGARIAFHSVPRWQSTGAWVQPPETIGDLDRRGESAGCLRVLPDDAVRVWDWLAEGDEVRVIN